MVHRFEKRCYRSYSIYKTNTQIIVASKESIFKFDYSFIQETILVLLIVLSALRGHVVNAVFSIIVTVKTLLS